MQSRARGDRFSICAAVGLWLLAAAVGLPARAAVDPAGVAVLDPKVTVGEGAQPGSTFSPVLTRQQRLAPSARRDAYAVITVNPDDSGLDLSLLDARGQRLGRWKPASAWVVLPPDGELVWVLGQRDWEGYVSRDEKAQFQGLTLYDFHGRLLTSVPADRTGAIGQALALPGGDLICLGARGLQRITTGGAVAWTAASTAHTLHPRTGGRFVFTESWDRDSDQRAVDVRDLNGQLLNTIRDSNQSHLGVAGVADGGAYVALKRLVVPGRPRWELAVCAGSDVASPVRRVELEGGAEGAAISDDGQVLAVVMNVGENGVVVRKVIGLGPAGERLFEVSAVADGPPDAVVSIAGRSVTVRRTQDVVRLEVAQ